MLFILHSLIYCGKYDNCIVIKWVYLSNIVKQEV